MEDNAKTIARPMTVKKVTGTTRIRAITLTVLVHEVPQFIEIINYGEAAMQDEVAGLVKRLRNQIISGLLEELK